MTDMIFHPSKNLTLGTEIELQILDPVTAELSPQGEKFLTEINKTKHVGEIKAELTCGMVELVSGIHENTDSLAKELQKINRFLIDKAEEANLLLAGGGTHAFQAWQNLEVSENFINIYKKYDFLVKKFTVFGQHIHIGCNNPDDAIYLIHAFARYVPHLIALSASSPFYEGEETRFHSTRSHVATAFPLSGHFPSLENWDEFSVYINKLKQLKIIEYVNNLYWDIRLRTDYGTLELRVCDAPLNLELAVALCAYAQTIALYFLDERNFKFVKTLYFPYQYNRFQASRYGLKGNMAVIDKNKLIPIHNDILLTLEILEPYAKKLDNEIYLNYLKKRVLSLTDDAEQLKKIYKNFDCNLKKMVQFQSQIWMNKFIKNDELIIP